MPREYFHVAFFYGKEDLMHQEFMELAIEEAKKGLNQTFTNPLVGAVLVKDNHVIAKGAHLKYGQNHAEKNAIEQCQSSEELINSTLYVTLEPCNHFGKQPPCSQLIIDSGIKKVVIGQLDPNPLVRGKGKAFLEKSGVEVIVGVAEEKVRQLNPFYNFFYQTQRPYIALKQAITLDGRIAMNQKRTAITGKAVWQKVHEERLAYQGILVGSQTVLTDDPELLAVGTPEFPPVRIVLDRRGRVLAQPRLKLFQGSEAPVWIFTEQPAQQPLPPHVEVICLPQVTIEQVIKELTKRKLQALYVEGGARIHDAFLASGYWDEVITYVAAKVMGGAGLSSFGSEREVEQLSELTDVKITQIGADLRISGRRQTSCLPD
jgi:diaminohydroxyphosphoribosylaminopyrimidine deaminase/5-amino-6-(5-phosphoribosylamino)uracil reductase